MAIAFKADEAGFKIIRHKLDLSKAIRAFVVIAHLKLLKGTEKPDCAGLKAAAPEHMCF